jgi:hypothetical protein
MEQTEECAKFNEFKTGINDLIEGIKKDAEKFYDKDNKAAGLRLRKGLKTIKQYVHKTINETLPKKVKQ